MILDIALPFHGDVEMFKESVKSVLSQSSSSWRLLIINDAHPDLEVDQWVTDLNDTRIKYIRNARNLGPSLNYTKCVELITGSHCLIFGADDILSQDYVEKMILTISQYPESDFFHPRVAVIDQSGKEYLPIVDKLKKILTPKNAKVLDLNAKEALPVLMTGNWMYFPAITWKLETVRKFGFRPDLNVCQDIWLIAQILISGGKFSLLPETLFMYRRFSGSDSSVKLLNGVRFSEEKLVFNTLASQMLKNQMTLSAFSAKVHLTSRLHALSLLPKAMKKRQNPFPCLRHLLT
jgi:glycosyltransferase involved in cell wall biosynthesis